MEFIVKALKVCHHSQEKWSICAVYPSVRSCPLLFRSLQKSCYKPMKSTFLTSQDDCCTNCKAPLVIPTCRELSWELLRHWQRWHSRVCLDGLEMRREVRRSKSLLSRNMTSASQTHNPAVINQLYLWPTSSFSISVILTRFHGVSQNTAELLFQRASYLKVIILK